MGLLPLVWLVGGWGSRVHHGDEFVGFAMAQFPGAIIFVPLSKLIDLPPLNGDWSFPIFVAAGFVMWAGFGWLLDPGSPDSGKADAPFLRDLEPQIARIFADGVSRDTGL